ncbi:MAG: hypothetical protein ACHQEM_08730, partial [Chitinophagales bacterium]
FLALKQFITIVIMLLALVATTFNKAIILLDYQVNKDYIATVLCVNKGNPGSCCKGKCYMNKKLQHQENQDKSTGGKEKFETDWFFDGPTRLLSIVLHKENYFEKHSLELPKPSSTSVFHPPLLCAL